LRDYDHVFIELVQIKDRVNADWSLHIQYIWMSIQKRKEKKRKEKKAKTRKSVPVKPVGTKDEDP
jgi:hypothetical protein